MALRRPGADPLIGRVFKDTYRVQDLIGEGSMGRVYGGEHLRLKKPIVIKIIGDELPGSEEIVARFRKEAILQAMVNHPAAVQTIDLDRTEDGTLYIVAEQAEGEGLDRILAREGHLSVERATGIVLQILEILSVAHEAKIVHRDLKPDNILIEKRGDRDIVSILDFGIAVLLDSDGQRSRRSGAASFYISPEQAAGESVDGRADLYSLGVLFYEMLTGDLPLEDENPDQFFVKLLNDYPPKLSESHPDLEVPRETEDTILACLSKDPFNRFESASDMLAKLSGTEGKKTRSFLVIAVLAVVLAAAGMGVLFIPGDNYSSADEDAARSAMQAASQTHPSYASARGNYDRAVAKKEAGIYDEAYQLFETARRGFTECVAYSDELQTAAEAALAQAEEARPTHATTVLGKSTIDEGVAMASEGRYTQAYRKFEHASVYLAYDDSAEVAATLARANAAKENPSFGVGDRLYREAAAIFEKRPLVEQDIELAARKFADARAEFARAVTYDETLEDEAMAAQRVADTMHPSYQELSKTLGDAAFAKSLNDYARAYELFESARDGFVAIAGKFDSARQLGAENARRTADAQSPLFNQGQAAYEAGMRAKQAGDYTTAYARFDEARSLFSKAVPFDTIHQQAAEQARLRSEQGHPKFAEAEAALQAGMRKKDSADYAGADRDFIRATELYGQAKPYDSRYERAANRARKRAYSGVPVSYAAAEEAWARAEQAKGDKDYQNAYLSFDEAGDLYKQARFDQDLFDDVASSKKRADPNHSSYGMAQRNEQEAIRAFEEGDGPLAEDKLAKANSLYIRARKRLSGPRDDNDDGGGNQVDPQKEARAPAKRAKSDADDLASKTGAWNDANTITRQTQASFEEGMDYHARATTAYKKGDFIGSIPLFEASLRALKKVSNQGR